jgi:hypothetical protein
VDEAALAQSFRVDLLDRADQARRPVTDDQQRADRQAEAFTQLCRMMDRSDQAYHSPKSA